MPIRQFEPNRAIEVIAPKYGSGYRLGGELVLTAAHLLDRVGSACEVRDKRSFSKEKAQVVWKAQGLDLALIELPKGVASVEAITLGQLPEVIAGEKLAFQMYAYPKWGRTQRDYGSAAGGRQIEGMIYLADRSPDGLLVLEPQRLPPEVTTTQSEWEGASGAAIICDGLVIAVQSQHHNPYRSASIEASPLWMVYSDERWRRLLEQHGIDPEPKIARLLAAAEKPLEIPWHRVSGQLLEERRQLTTNPMTRRGDVVYEVDQVFVPLGLMECKEVPRQKMGKSPERGSELYQEGIRKGNRESDSEQKEVGEGNRESDSEQKKIITQKFEHQQFLEQVLQQGESPNSLGRRIAIIGEPGAGKTTLLQQISLWLLATFPASIVIWVSLADLKDDTLESYLEHRWLRGVVRKLGRAETSQADTQNFAEQFSQGRVWLLVDGLDEMRVTNNPLSDIKRQIQEGGWLQQARILLTCRVNLWGRSDNALFDTFDTYRTLEFSESGQVERFIAKWFALRGEHAIQQGQALCDALQEPGKERIRDLVKNPLRLTLLCFDWYAKSGRLPETRAELYQRFVERIYDWKAEEFPTIEEQRQTLNRDLAQLSLAAIDDQDERGNARFRLRHQFVRQHLSKESLELALKLGWLNDIGVDAEDLSETVYAFYHTTFEEYFAALAIEDWDFFLPCEHRNRPVKNKPYRIFEPQWKQVLLLWMGRKGRELGQGQNITPQKEALIQALMTFKDGCKGFYSDRAFLLAVAGIAEFKDCTQADTIVDQLVHWLCSRSNGPGIVWLKRFDLDSVRVKTRNALATSAIGSTDHQRAIEALVQMLNSTQDQDTRRKVAESLGKIGTGNEMAIQALVQLLDSDIRSEAAESLGRIDLGYEKTIQRLVQLLHSFQNTDTRRKAVESLGQIGTGNEMAIQALVQLLDSTHDQYTREIASESLGKIGSGNEAAIQALVQLLASTQHGDIDNFSQAVILGKKNTQGALVRWLTSTQRGDIHTCSQAIISLGKIGTGNETAIRALVQILEFTPEIPILVWYPNIFLEAEESLCKIGTGNETAIRSLVQILESTQDYTNTTLEEDYTHRRVARILGNIGKANETAIRALVHLLESAQDYDTIKSTTYSLAQIGKGNEVVIRALVRLFESTQNYNLRMSAAISLNWAVDETASRIFVRLIRFPFRLQETYQLMMKCADALPYPEFYQAFHAPR